MNERLSQCLHAIKLLCYLVTVLPNHLQQAGPCLQETWILYSNSLPPPKHENPHSGSSDIQYKIGKMFPLSKRKEGREGEIKGGREKRRGLNLVKERN